MLPRQKISRQKFRLSLQFGNFTNLSIKIFTYPKLKEDIIMSKKGENIYKRKDKRWEARYIKGYHPDGSPKYGYCYGKTYREAKQKVTGAKAA